MQKRPGGKLYRSPDMASKSQLFPVLSKGNELTKKAFLIPVIVTVGFVSSMFATIGKTQEFQILIATYLALGAYYFIYLLCGKKKPWWILLGSAFFTIIVLITPLLHVFIFVFRVILPGGGSNPPAESESTSIIALFIHMLFGAGLMEELIKALPVIALSWWALRSPDPRKERYGVCEPLDGILIGAASGAGFTLLETLGQYVPEAIKSVGYQYGEGAGFLVGLQLLIPRILGSLFGHMAYSGYLGYFIGLAMLKPANRWVIFIVGYLTAAVIHALWNVSGAIGSSFAGETGGILANCIVGGMSYVLLAAAILKARQISPTRQENFTSRIINSVTQAPFTLYFNGHKIPLHPDCRIQSNNIPGLRTSVAQEGLVAVVNYHPNDPNILGLKNISSVPWNVTMADGSIRLVPCGKSIKLAAGNKIDFGGVIGQIH
jgi:RsiW-degrading membrane proteinase PrsW (M82 family)